jgi:hypothetical protein
MQGRAAANRRWGCQDVTATTMSTIETWQTDAQQVTAVICFWSHTVPMSVNRGPGSRMWVDTAALHVQVVASTVGTTSSRLPQQSMMRTGPRHLYCLLGLYISHTQCPARLRAARAAVHLPERRHCNDGRQAPGEHRIHDGPKSRVDKEGGSCTGSRQSTAG